ncbi:MAG: sodium:glutamate symporter, partial [Oscillospiraceae bacterium]|nr:sodium:glutamate symporter [Oscillospiraceae bacterium]
MITIEMNMYHATAIAALVLMLGRLLVKKVPIFSRYCIPAPVVGGLVYSLVHLVLYMTGIATINFDGTLQSFFMTVFFTSVGFMASFALLKKGGVQVFIFLGVSIVLVTCQDIIGSVLAGVLGLDPRLGLAMGSIPLVGGHGTAGSFGPMMEELGIEGAAVVSLAAATYGLVSGSMMGGPVATARLKKHNLKSTVTSVAQNNDAAEAAAAPEVNNEKFLNAALYFALAIGAGELISKVFVAIGMTMPSYIGAMLAAAAIRNIVDAAKVEAPMAEIDALGNLSLNLFLAMALMGLKLWQLIDLALPMI